MDDIQRLAIVMKSRIDRALIMMNSTNMTQRDSRVANERLLFLSFILLVFGFDVAKVVKIWEFFADKAN
jgi:hypothetical protein